MENRTLKAGSSPPPSRGGNLAGHKRPHLQSISLPLERGHESFITKDSKRRVAGSAKRAGSQARASRSTFPGLEDCALQYIRAEPCLRLSNMNDHNLHSHLGVSAPHCWSAHCQLDLKASDPNPSFSTGGVSDPGRGSKWTSCLKGLHYKSDLSVLV